MEVQSLSSGTLLEYFLLQSLVARKEVAIVDFTEMLLDRLGLKMKIGKCIRPPLTVKGRSKQFAPGIL